MFRYNNCRDKFAKPSIWNSNCCAFEDPVVRVNGVFDTDGVLESIMMRGAT
jgi:hypothetical protein